MTKELELKLLEKYPKILANYGGDKKLTCMYWGMEHDDGWYEILDEGMEKIQYFCDRCATGVQLIADQIKEKYGTLSFYYSVKNASKLEYSILDDIVVSLEKKSTRTCEVSGKDGSLCRKSGWYKTVSYEKARELGYIASDEGLEEYWKDLDKKAGKSEKISSES
jgi:ribosomal protein S27AE